MIRTHRRLENVILDRNYMGDILRGAKLHSTDPEVEVDFNKEGFSLEVIKIIKEDGQVTRPRGRDRICPRINWNNNYVNMTNQLKYSLFPKKGHSLREHFPPFSPFHLLRVKGADSNLKGGEQM